MSLIYVRCGKCQECAQALQSIASGAGASRSKAGLHWNLGYMTDLQDQLATIVPHRAAAPQQLLRANAVEGATGSYHKLPLSADTYGPSTEQSRSRNRLGEALETFIALILLP